MPAPAVIPASIAYSNAVAVKGFVVELRAVQELTSVPASGKRPVLCLSVNIRNEYTGTFASHSRSQRLRGAARVFTVTKKARPKQSFDMNLKAWDNNEAAYGVPFRLLLVLNLCGRLWTRMTSGSGFPSPHLRRDVGFGLARRLAWSRNEGGLFGGERT